MKGKRALALILAAALTAGSLLSCSESNPETPDETADVQAQTAEEPAAVEEEDDMSAELGATHFFEKQEAVDYDGWTFHMANNPPSTGWFLLLSVEELNGDEFNDGIYNRNTTVAEKFNVEITESRDSAVNDIRACVTAGTGDVAIGNVIMNDAMGMISGNYTLPMSDMNVDFSKPYWDQGALKTLTIFDKMWYGYCDFGFDHYESMGLLYYNGFLLEDNGISDTPYNLYMEGGWTIDKMYDMMTTVARDLNGDGAMDQRHDLFGFTGRELEYLPSLYSSGARLIVYSEDEQSYVMNLEDNRVMAIGDWMNKCINDKNLSIPGNNDESRNLFKEGRSLFYCRLLGDFRNLRDKEDDYGIICFPYLDTNDDVMVYVQNPYQIMVPSDCQDTDRVSVLIEAMAAYTYDYVLEPYITKAVIGKGTRDQQSAELLRDFIGRRAFDLCYAFGVKSAIDSYVSAMKNGNYASLQKRSGKMFTKSIDRNMAALRGE